MVKTRLGQGNSGFTIIEVLFVLAIAGVMALLIFQAIPTLVRNSRNGERKSGVVSVLRAVSRYELNNSGTMPPACNGVACFGVNTFTNEQRLAYYNDPTTTRMYVCNGSYSSGSLNYGVGPCAVLPTVTDVDKIYVFNYLRCSGASFTVTGAGYSDIAALYATENPNGSGAAQCKQL